MNIFLFIYREWTNKKSVTYQTTEKLIKELNDPSN